MHSKGCRIFQLLVANHFFSKLQKKSSGSGSSAAEEKVDYVVVDKEKTLALTNTRKAWTDERQSTESETPTKSVK